MSSDAERRRRAEDRRRRAVLRKSRLQATEQDLSPTRGADAISLVTELTLESWTAAGRPLPTYRRDQIPCRFVPGRRQ
ncbi:MAG: hypothetical protein ACOCXM_11855 [Myxococcota bacterium]